MGPMLPCAWWLLPAQPQHARLQRLIGQLAGEFGGPVFEPHMTLALCELPAAWLHAQARGTAGDAGTAGAAGTASPAVMAGTACTTAAAGAAGVAGGTGAASGPGAEGTAGSAQVLTPAARWAARLAGLLPAVTLDTDGIGHSPHHFRVFHLRLAPSARERATLAAWRGWLWAALMSAREPLPAVDVLDPGFPPHLSLAYGDWPEAQRAAQAMRVAPMLPACLAAGAGSHGAGEGSRGNGLLQFDTLLGICPRPGAQDMARVADWHVFARVPLRP